ncbi:type II secretion system secretin GspD [Pseudomonadota bacterium]
MRWNKNNKTKSGILRRIGHRCLVKVVGGALAAFVAIAPALAESNITFNLKDAELQTVVATVAEFTGKNFIIDPRVKGKVTVISAKPMSADEVYQTFLSLLEVHNFAAVEVGNIIKILPSVNAKQQGGSGVDTGRLEITDEIITRVIELKHVSASQLVPILRPLVPQQGHMAAYAATNVLIVSDRSANVKRLISIINSIDVASSATNIEVYALEHAGAAEVVRILESLRQQGKRGKGKDPSNDTVLVADERTNSILISGAKSERLGLRAIIAHLDTPLESSGNTHVVYLNYAKAKDLVPVLTGLGESLQKEKQGGGKGKTVAARSPVTIQAHETTNSLVITAPQDLMRSMQGVIKKLDVRRAQVLVEATIADVSLDESGALGVSWFVDGSPGNKGPIAGTLFNSPIDAAPAAVALANGDLPAISTPTSFLGVGRFNSSNIDATVLLTALEGAGKANVLSRPVIMTLDNEEAEIVVGQNVPFLTGSYTSTGSGSSTPTNPFTTIKRENVGVTLKVKPQINEGNAVRLDIEQKVDSVAPSSSGAADLITNTRSIKTSVLIDDGGTIVLGGLIKDDMSETESKVPGLGDIPFIGALFRFKSSTKNKTNLMIFLKPSIVRDAAVATKLTSGKYDYMRAEQLKFRDEGVIFIENEDIPVLPEFLGLPPSFDEVQSQTNDQVQDGK